MRKAFSFLPLLLFSIPAFCQLTYTQNLKQIAQIKFPERPVIKELPKGITMYYCKTDSGIYFAQVASYKKSLSELFTNSVNENIYDAYINGNVNSSNGKLIYKKKILVDNLEGVAYVYHSTLPKRTFYSYSRLIFLNDTLLNFSLLSKDPLLNNDPKLIEFYKSLKIAVPANKIVTDNGPELLSRFGYVIGIVAILLAGVILVYKRSLQRKNLS